MAADSSIYSLIQQPKLASPVESLGGVLQLKALMDQQGLQGLQRRQLEEGFAEKQRIRDLFSGGNTPSEADVMAASPTTGLAYTKANLENQRTKAAIDKDKVAALKDTIDIHRNALGPVNDQMAFSAWRANIVKDVPQFASTIPEQFSPDVKRDLMLKGEDLVKQLTPRFEMVDLGGRRQAVDMNPVTNPSIKGMTMDKTATPGEKLTDTRQREFYSPPDTTSPDGQRQVDFWASVVRMGGSLPPGLARGPGGSAFVREVTRKAAMGDVTPTELMANQAGFQGQKAGERTLGTRTANIEMAATEAASLSQLAKEASAKVDRTQYKSLNEVLQAGQRATSSPELRAFTAANTSLINAYARAINPQGVGTVADKEHARDMLSTGFSKGDYAATVDQLLKEIDAARKSPGQVKREMREQFTGKAEKAAPAPAAPVSPAPKAGGIKFLGFEGS